MLYVVSLVYQATRKGLTPDETLSLMNSSARTGRVSTRFRDVGK